MTTATASKPASDKQISLIRTLCDERGLDLFDFANGVLEENDFDTSHLTGGRDGTASQLITALFASKPAREGTTKVDPDEGLYRVEDEIVRIKLSKSGNWYATMGMKIPGRKTLQWEYLGKRINMADAVKMTDIEAGKFFGYCMKCSALLEDPDSIAAGIGPVCAKKGA